MLRIEPRGGVRGDDGVPGRDPHVADGEVADREPQRQRGDGRVGVQRLVHDGVPADPPGPHGRQLLGAAQQGDDGVADQVHGGLETGPDHQQQCVEQFLLAEPVAVLVADPDQLGRHVVAGVRGLVPDQRGQHRADLPLHGRRVLRGRVGGVHDGRDEPDRVLP